MQCFALTQLHLMAFFSDSTFFPVAVRYTPSESIERHYGIQNEMNRNTQ